MNDSLSHGRFSVFRVEVIALPGLNTWTGRMGVEEEARWITDLPLLVVVVELDRGGTVDFQAADLAQINGFRVEATNVGRWIDAHYKAVHDPSFCWTPLRACWWNSGFLTRFARFREQLREKPWPSRNRRP